MPNDLIEDPDDLSRDDEIAVMVALGCAPARAEFLVAMRRDELPGDVVDTPIA